MRHYIAKKETTYGTLLIKPGEIIAFNDDDTPDDSIWQLHSGADFASGDSQTVSTYGSQATPIPPAVLQKLAAEDAQLELAALRDEVKGLRKAVKDAATQHEADSAVAGLLAAERSSNAVLTAKVEELTQQLDDQNMDSRNLIEDLGKQNDELKAKLAEATKSTPKGK